MKCPKVIWTVSEEFLKGIGKPLRNAQITQISTGQMVLLAGCYEKTGKCDCHPIGDKPVLPSDCQQKCSTFYLFLEATYFLFLCIKSQRRTGK
jgi:hypothetical protein